MPHLDYYIPMGIGGLFIIVGVATMFWARRGEKKYYNSLSAKSDVKEPLERWSERPGHGAFKMGSLITIIVGSILLALGGAFSVLD